MRVQKAPNARYTFDSERDATQSELCREEKGKPNDCIIVRMGYASCSIDSKTRYMQLQMHSKKLFEAMQV